MTNEEALWELRSLRDELEVYPGPGQKTAVPWNVDKENRKRAILKCIRMLESVERGGYIGPFEDTVYVALTRKPDGPMNVGFPLDLEEEDNE